MIQKYNIAYTVSIGGNILNIVPGSVFIQPCDGRRRVAFFKTQAQDYIGMGVYLPFQPVSIVDKDEALVFTGHVKQILVSKIGFDPTIEGIFTCYDQHYLADKHIFEAEYVHTSPEQIVQDIVQALSHSGVTIGEIHDSGVIIPKVRYDMQYISMVLDDLVCKVSASGEEYYWGIDLYKKLYFVPCQEPHG